MIASTQVGRVKQSSDVIMDLFEHVGLRKILRKIVIMVFHTCHSPGGMLVEAYTRWITGKGPTYQYRLRW